MEGASIFNGKPDEKLNLKYKEYVLVEAPNVNLSTTNKKAGPSSLIGLRGDNVTYHPQSSYKKGYFNLLWHWA